jgi:threonine dehydrogenase-like Zn-dependent dehydrogenase
VRELAVFPAERRVRIIDRDAPRALGPTQVLLRPREIGVCGTDREIAAFEYGEPPPGADHLTLGHEALVEVVDVGSGVQHLRRGDLAVPIVRRPCAEPACRPCRAGRQDFCTTNGFVERGIKGADGFLAELAVDDEEYLVPVPQGLAEVGVLIEPLTVVAKGVFQARKLRERLPWDSLYERALVLGAGPIGLLAAMGTAASGFSTVVFSREPSDGDRATFVRSFGAKYASADETPLEETGRRFGPFDVLVDATGVSSLVLAALDVLGPNGTAVLTGVPGHRPPSLIDSDRLVRGIVLKNQAVFGTVNAGRSDYVEALHFLEMLLMTFPEAVPRLITGRFPLEAAPELLARPTGIKDVVHFDATGA